MFDRISFVIGETMIALGRNIVLAIAAITTVAISLYLVAGVHYIGFRSTEYLGTVSGRFEMVVNLKKGVTPADIQRTGKYLRIMPGVASATWLSAQQKWDQEKKLHPDMTEGLGDDSPYPEQYRVRLTDLAKGDRVAATIQKMTTVDTTNGVIYAKEAQNRVAQWIPFIETVATRIGQLLFVVAGVLVFNAIRLTVESRRVEIRVMRLVGASRIVVNLPFILEGVLQGLCGGAIAAFALFWSQHLLQTQLTQLAMDASLAPFPLRFYLTALCVGGAGYGGICSVLALATPLRSRRF